LQSVSSPLLLYTAKPNVKNESSGARTPSIS
jgi:hypothetical protein